MWADRTRIEGMDFRDVIERRKRGNPHLPGDLEFLCQQVALSESDPSRTVPDYQVSAWLMAAVLNPLSLEDSAELTRAMVDGGERLSLAGIPKPWVDKHSTGGVGDKTTLILLPILSACGLTMVKMSGRGLGITGGTIDKLESIPGFRTDLSPEEMVEQAKRIGIALTGQTPKLAPADKALYALRDVTATVDSMPLIASSILSKKAAAGAETIVIDLKWGSGAFMKTKEAALELSEVMLGVAERLHLNLKIAITDMNQPLGRSAGNALEVWEALDTLEGRGDADLTEFCVRLAGIALAACGKSATTNDGETLAKNAISSGSAMEKLRQWIETQGGKLAEFSLMRSDLMGTDLNHDGPAGFVAKLDAECVGKAVLELGGGRKVKTDPIDPMGGVWLHRKIGESVLPGEPLVTLYGSSKSQIEAASDWIRKAYEFSQEAVEAPPLIWQVR